MLIAIVQVLLAFVAADYATDLSIDQTHALFMDQLKTVLNRTNQHVALQISSRERNSSDDYAIYFDYLQKISKDVVDPLVAQYNPIAYKIIHDAGYNTNGEYYVYDITTQKWRVPGHTVLSTLVDGASWNARHLSQELRNGFSQLVSIEKGASNIQKRWLPDFHKPVSSLSTKITIRNLKALPLPVALQKAKDFKPDPKSIEEYNKACKEAWDKIVEKYSSVVNGLKELENFFSKVDEYVEPSEILKLLEMRRRKLIADLDKLYKDKSEDSQMEAIRKDIAVWEEILSAFEDIKPPKLEKSFDQTLIDELIEKLEIQSRVRGRGTKRLRDFLQDVDEIPDWKNRIEMLEELLNELQDTKNKTPAQNIDIEVLEFEIETLDYAILEDRDLLKSQALAALKRFLTFIGMMAIFKAFFLNGSDSEESGNDEEAH